MLRFIGFGHRRQMGKDTAAQAFKKLLEMHFPTLNVECRAFADPMYEICHKLWGWDGFQTKEYYDLHPQEKNLVLPHVGKTPRTLLIELGTPAVRQVIWEDTWIQYLMNLCPKEEQRLVLVSDMRMPREFEAIKEAGGFCIKVTRPGIEVHSDVADSALEGVKFDHDILNDSDPLNLGVQTWIGLERWLHGRGDSILNWLCAA